VWRRPAARTRSQVRTGTPVPLTLGMAGRTGVPVRPRTGVPVRPRTGVPGRPRTGTQAWATAVIRPRPAGVRLGPMTAATRDLTAAVTRGLPTRYAGVAPTGPA